MPVSAASDEGGRRGGATVPIGIRGSGPTVYCDVRWIELTDSSGRGVRFSADRPLFAQALRYTWEDLYFARHQQGEKRRNVPLVPRDEIHLNLDIGQSGLGDMSFRPLDTYRYFPCEERFVLRIDGGTVR